MTPIVKYKKLDAECGETRQNRKFNCLPPRGKVAEAPTEAG